MLKECLSSTATDEVIIKKAKAMIEQSNTKEQLKTTRNFIDLFTNGDDNKKKIKEELIQLWLEKDKILFPEPLL
jgi:hypothetical protein